MSKQSMGQKRCLKENKKQTKQNYIELSDGDGGFHYATSSSSTPFSDSGSASHTAPGIPWSSEQVPASCQQAQRCQDCRCLQLAWGWASVLLRRSPGNVSERTPSSSHLGSYPVQQRHEAERLGKVDFYASLL